MCKTIRKKIITGILEKYNLVEAKVDHGKKKKKTTKKQKEKDLDDWKLRRAAGGEGWKKPKFGGPKFSTKRKKKYQKYKVFRFSNCHVIYKKKISKNLLNFNKFDTF